MFNKRRVSNIKGEIMKMLRKAGSATLLAMAVSAAWAQAPAPKAATAQKGDPKVAECRAHNHKEHAQIMAMHAKAMKAHKISPAEEKAFRAMEGRLHKHQATLAKGGLTLAECHQLTKELNHERAEVAKMAASGPAPKGPTKK